MAAWARSNGAGRWQIRSFNGIASIALFADFMRRTTQFVPRLRAFELTLPKAEAKTPFT
jgi:hypothetical protein